MRRPLAVIGSCTSHLRRDYSRCRLVCSRCSRSHWVVSCSEPYSRNLSSLPTTHRKTLLLCLLHHQPHHHHRHPTKQQRQTRQEPPPPPPPPSWMGRTMTSRSTRSSRGASATRSRARSVARSYTGYMPRILECSACARLFRNCALVRRAGMGRSFGASSVRQLGSARRRLALMISPRSKWWRKEGITSGRRSLGARRRCSRLGRAWRRSCGGLSRRCAGFRTSLCGAALRCAGLGSTRRRMTMTMTMTIVVHSRCVIFDFFWICVALKLRSQIYLDTEGEDADEPLRATHVISALPLPVLDSVLQPPPAGEAAAGGASTTHPSLPHLRANPHSSVTVLNLVFPTTTSTPNGSTGEAATSTSLHPPGFGYLIPRPEHGYSEPGREDEEELGPGLLGVVFDTASLPEQDHDAANDAASVGFTKLTAMLGGPYPSPHPRDPSSSSSESESESDAQLVAAVLPHISSQLGHALPPPVHYAVHRNVESIPTYLVGHTARMEELRRVLSERWGGRLKVVGAGVGGVSVADCVKAGRQAAFEVGAQINSRT